MDKSLQVLGPPQSAGYAVCYANDAFVREEEASLTVLDHGLLYGDGVFDTVVAWQGRLFRFHDHAARLFRSMQAVALEPPCSQAELLEFSREALFRNGLETAYVKWVVSRGDNGTPLMDPKGCRSHLIIIVRPYIERFSSRSDAGISLKSVAIRRTPNQCLDARIKSLNYLNLVLAKMEAQRAGADEALMLDVYGNVCEAPGYNVFLVREGELYTPARDILEGITRSSVFSIARDHGRTVREADLGLYDAYVADEVFLTSTAGGLIPVSEIDGRQIGSGRPGPVFRACSAAYAEMLGSAEWGVAIAQQSQSTGGNEP